MSKINKIKAFAMMGLACVSMCGVSLGADAATDAIKDCLSRPTPQVIASMQGYAVYNQDATNPIRDIIGDSEFLSAIKAAGVDLGDVDNDPISAILGKLDAQLTKQGAAGTDNKNGVIVFEPDNGFLLVDSLAASDPDDLVIPNKLLDKYVTLIKTNFGLADRVVKASAEVVALVEQIQGLQEALAAANVSLPEAPATGKYHNKYAPKTAGAVTAAEQVRTSEAPVPAAVGKYARYAAAATRPTAAIPAAEQVRTSETLALPTPAPQAPAPVSKYAKYQKQ